MPFVNDTAWPERLKAIFTISRADSDSLENPYTGPYDKMMNYCFGEDFDFFIAPQAPPGDAGRDAVDFIVCLLVLDIQKRPVFLIEVKDDAHINSATKRQAADEQMRGRYNELLYKCPIPTLYGVSVLGTKMRVYSGVVSKRKVYPPRVSIDPERVLDQDRLAQEWNVDILSKEGFIKMKEMVDFVKQESAALQA